MNGLDSDNRKFPSNGHDRSFFGIFIEKHTKTLMSQLSHHTHKKSCSLDFFEKEQ